MNVLMVNPVHPSTPHISAVRAWRFAEELAHRGHRVVLLTAHRADGGADQGPPTDNHDWHEPLVLSFAGVNRKVPSVSPPRPLRRAATAVRLFRDGGRNGAWVRASVAGVTRSHAGFKPDVVWCTFGTMEGVFAAKQIAKVTGCPWVLDVKDNWELYVPRGMRRLMAWRIKGWSAITANAESTAYVAAKWHDASPAVIYSRRRRTLLSGA